MPIYVTSYKLSESGSKNINQLAERMEDNRRSAEQIGGKVLGLYITMGKYDFLSLVDWPTDEIAAAMSLVISERGNAQTTTMRAFTEEEFANIVKRLPKAHHEAAHGAASASGS